MAVKQPGSTPRDRQCWRLLHLVSQGSGASVCLTPSKNKNTCVNFRERGNNHADPELRHSQRLSSGYLKVSGLSVQTQKVPLQILEEYLFTLLKLLGA